MNSTSSSDKITTILGALAALSQVFGTFAPALGLSSLGTPVGIFGAAAIGVLGYFTNKGSK